MRRKRFHHVPKNSTFALNITSMTDMFTVLLVFLLQSYTSSQIEVKMPNDIELPISNSERNPTQAVQLIITKNKILIDDREIASIENLNLKNSDLDKDDDNFIVPLFNALEDLNKKRLASAQNTPDPKKTLTEIEKEKAAEQGKILILADSSFSYQVVKKIMYTSSMAGFPQVRLATLAGN